MSLRQTTMAQCIALQINVWDKNKLLRLAAHELQESLQVPLIRPFLCYPALPHL
jgi:hypothetical protein